VARRRRGPPVETRCRTLNGMRESNRHEDAQTPPSSDEIRIGEGGRAGGRGLALGGPVRGGQCARNAGPDARIHATVPGHRASRCARLRRRLRRPPRSPTAHRPLRAPPPAAPRARLFLRPALHACRAHFTLRRPGALVLVPHPAPSPSSSRGAHPARLAERFPLLLFLHSPPPASARGHGQLRVRRAGRRAREAALGRDRQAARGGHARVEARVQDSPARYAPLSSLPPLLRRREADAAP
jgi:hypothetical protein